MEVFIGNVLSSLTGFDFASEQKFDFSDSAFFVLKRWERRLVLFFHAHVLMTRTKAVKTK